VFLSSVQRTQNTKLNWRNNADWYAQGEVNYAWFGYEATCIPLPSQRGSLLLVAAPENSLVEYKASASGKLYGYQVSVSEANKLRSKLVFSVISKQPFDKLGKSLSVGNPFSTNKSLGDLYVAIGMPTHDTEGILVTYPQGGAGVIVSVNELLKKGNTTLGEVSSTTYIDSEQPYSRLAWTLQFYDLNRDGISDFWLSAPNFDTLFGVDAGAAYVWKGGGSFPEGTVQYTSFSADWCLHSTIHQAYYARTVNFLDFNGNGKVDVAVAGPRDSNNGYQAGSVSLILDAFGGL